MAQRLTRKKRASQDQAAIKQQAEQRRLERQVAMAARPLFGTGGSGNPRKKPALAVPDYADSSRYPSIMTNSPLNTARPVTYDSAEMIAREQVAQKQIAEKRKRVAVVCHKSGYQYVGESEDPRTFGKKAQALD